MLTIHRTQASALAADIRRLLDITPAMFANSALQQREIAMVVAMRRREILESLRERGLEITGIDTDEAPPRA